LWAVDAPSFLLYSLAPRANNADAGRLLESKKKTIFLVCQYFGAVGVCKLVFFRCTMSLFFKGVPEGRPFLFGPSFSQSPGLLSCFLVSGLLGKGVRGERVN